MHRSFLSRATGAFGHRVFSTVRTDMWCRALVDLPPRQPRHDGVTFAVVAAATDPLVSSVVDPAFAPLCEEAFARGDVLHLAVGDGAVLAWRAVTLQSHVESDLGLRIRLAPGEAYSYALWVDPDMRGRHVGEFLVVESLHAMAATLSAKTALLAIDRHNTPASGLMSKLGYHPVDSVRCVRVLGHGHELAFTRTHSSAGWSPTSRKSRRHLPISGGENSG